MLFYAWRQCKEPACVSRQACSIYLMYFTLLHVLGVVSTLLICQHPQVQSCETSGVYLSVSRTSITGNVYIHVWGWTLQEDTAAKLMEQNWTNLGCLGWEGRQGWFKGRVFVMSIPKGDFTSYPPSSFNPHPIHRLALCFPLHLLHVLFLLSCSLAP